MGSWAILLIGFGFTDEETRMKTLSIVLTTLAALGVVCILFIYSGFYNMGADAHHWTLTSQVIGTLRDRSIATHSQDIQPPALGDSNQVLKGAGQYAAMCVGCHLAPGMKDSELRPGLYPTPPNLSQTHIDAKEAFWIIKHGIKMSAMPAWGSSHDDATIWSLVAFLQKLPALNASQYKAIVAKAPRDEEMDMPMNHQSNDDDGK